MKKLKNQKIKELMDAISKGATHIVANPETIKKLQEQGVPIEERFIPYEEYVEEIFEKRKKDAVGLLRKLPKIDESIADGVIGDIFEEIRSSYGFGIFTSTIFNSILLLEYAMRSRLYEKRLKSDSKAEWADLEKLDMNALIQQLSKYRLINKEEKAKLVDFSKNFRNPYLHINILKLTSGIYIQKLPGINVNKGETIEMKNVEAGKHRFLWFAAKRFFDKSYVQLAIDFCVDWTNKLLKK